MAEKCQAEKKTIFEAVPFFCPINLCLCGRSNLHDFEHEVPSSGELTFGFAGAHSCLS
jgi:hypothetical protein